MGLPVRNILIVEDNASIREVLLPMLEIWMEGKGMEASIHEAGNGMEALAWVQTHGEPDLLLLDVRMPRMDGAEFLRHIASLGHDVRKKTLLLTGHWKRRRWIWAARRLMPFAR